MGKKQVQRTFIPGSEWLYYKVYCGIKTADDILIDIIKPLTNKLLKEQHIDKWFFIRYSDPEPHLRIRFHLTEQQYLEPIMRMVKEQLLPLVHNNQIWDLQLATYQRELNRYGTKTIATAEAYFFYDSLEVIKILESSKNNDEERFLQIFSWIEYILSLFFSTIENQLFFLKKMEKLFKEEFSISKTTRKELSNKYRKMELPIDKATLFSGVHKKKTQALANKFLALEKKKRLEPTLEEIISSFIHMTINRGFRSKQRLYEMMIYDFLYRKNKSKIARYAD